MLDEVEEYVEKQTGRKINVLQINSVRKYNDQFL